MLLKSSNEIQKHENKVNNQNYSRVIPQKVYPIQVIDQNFNVSDLNLKEFVKQFGHPFSEILGIDLHSGKNKEILKWFLASILYSKPIREGTAT